MRLVINNKDLSINLNNKKEFTLYETVHDMIQEVKNLLRRNLVGGAYGVGNIVISESSTGDINLSVDEARKRMSYIRQITMDTLTRYALGNITYRDVKYNQDAAMAYFTAKVIYATQEVLNEKIGSNSIKSIKIFSAGNREYIQVTLEA